ncbi:MAG: RNA-binding protein [Lentisphaerota bacterium]
MPSTLYVGNLPYSVDGDVLNKMFTAFGTVESAKVITDSLSGRSKGFGFVDMANAEDAQKAIKDLDGTETDGRKIVVNLAKPKEDKPRREGGFRREGGYAPRREGGYAPRREGGFSSRRD